MNKLYQATPDGYCGDEDNGQTSAWYVFSSLGFYPVTPGVNQYVLGSPLFDRATLHLQNGNTFTIKAKNNSEENYYVESVSINNEAYSRNFLEYETIQKGGELIFNLGSEPNKSWGSKLEDTPFSLSKN